MSSVVALTAYFWLLHNTSAALVGTYAFVNPLIAVAMGWAFAGEAITTRVILAAGLILAGVAAIMLTKNKSTVNRQ